MDKINKNIAIIIPCYNEENRLDKDAFNSFSKKNDNIDFYFANDGSSDKTIDIITSFSKENINNFVIDFGKNSGKAETVRKSLLKIAKSDKDYEFIGFFDADLATPLSEINFMYNEIAKRTDFENIEYVLGTRFSKLGSEINRKASRHYIGRIFATIASIMLDLRVYDTQCGAKFIKPKLALSIMKEPFITKWLFDVEILFRIINLYGKEASLSKMIEIPLNKWEEIGGSKLKPMDFLKAPLELWKINKKYKK